MGTTEHPFDLGNSALNVFPLRLICSLSHCFYWRSSGDWGFLTFPTSPQTFPRRCLRGDVLLSVLVCSICTDVLIILYQQQLHKDCHPLRERWAQSSANQELSSTCQGQDWCPRNEDGIVETICKLEKHKQLITPQNLTTPAVRENERKFQCSLPLLTMYSD